MMEKNKGHIVTVASTASYLGLAGITDYCGTKAAVLAFHEGILAPLCLPRARHSHIAGLNAELKHKYKVPNVLTTSIHPVWVRTPLIAPFEKTLRAAGSPMIDAHVVSDAIADQIFKCSGAQVFLPSRVGRVSAVRGWPNWMQEAFRGMVSKGLLPATEQQK